ncbi:MAG: formylglycine-generating enzyme family protein, partial [Planctomycetota bacterium]|nr:formylglycine-generating enzyme family protein [Planctomycetota bacterium]
MDAIEYCRKLSTAEGNTYRLPTEAEWEFACRSGTSTAYSFGQGADQLKVYGWFFENAWNIDEKYAHEVGTKRANPFGLYDMHGNVWEWCSDWSGEYNSSTAVDPIGPLTGSTRVNRGGSWFSSARFCWSAIRDWDVPS